MFASGGTEPLDNTRELLKLVSEAIQELSNKISIKGHTDAIPFSTANGYGNWELSADRANASRRVLEQAGVGAERIAEVVGRADQDLLLPDDPTHHRNRRISIILLRDAPSQPLTDTVLERREPASEAETPAQAPAPSSGPSILGRD
jgi:chemotaxis protein MotB